MQAPPKKTNLIQDDDDSSSSCDDDAESKESIDLTEEEERSDKLQSKTQLYTFSQIKKMRKDKLKQTKLKEQLKTAAYFIE